MVVKGGGVVGGTVVVGGVECGDTVGGIVAVVGTGGVELAMGLVDGAGLSGPHPATPSTASAAMPGIRKRKRDFGLCLIRTPLMTMLRKHSLDIQYSASEIELSPESGDHSNSVP